MLMSEWAKLNRRGISRCTKGWQERQMAKTAPTAARWRRWTDKEDAYLLDHVERMTYTEMALKLRRTWRAVDARLKLLRWWRDNNVR